MSLILRDLEGILRDGSECLVGELLREATFVGEGYGCYSDFTVRAGAVQWNRQRRVDYWRSTGYDETGDSDITPWDQAAECADMGEGYTYTLDGLRIDVCWFWDGDGVLEFTVYNSHARAIRKVVNGDCKKDHYWKDDDLPNQAEVAA